MTIAPQVFFCGNSIGILWPLNLLGRLFPRELHRETVIVQESVNRGFQTVGSRFVTKQRLKREVKKEVKRRLKRGKIEVKR